jgi:hypothetical protein
MKKQSILLLSIMLTSLSLNSIDLPNFYRATFFQGTPRPNLNDFTTNLDIRYGEGHSATGFNENDDTTSVLDIYGNVDVNKLGINLEGLSATNKPTTFQYLDETTGTIPGYSFTGNNGKIKLTGKFNTQEVDFTLHQNLLLGLFAQIYVPLRWLTTKEIGYTNLTDSTNANATAFQTFLTNEFDTVLSENGYQPLTTKYDKDGISDVAVSLGWNGYSEDFGIIKSLGGTMQIGVVIPFASKQNLDIVGEVPLGYDEHTGFIARGKAQSFINDYFSIGINAGIIAFMPKNMTKRMQTDQNQSGLIVLERGFGDITKGAIWDAGFYLGGHLWSRSISFILGYSATFEEATRIGVNDGTLLSTFIAANQADATAIRKTSKDEIVNSDDRLKEWQNHVLHFMISYDAARHLDKKFTPHFSAFYDYPFLGKYSYQTDRYGGELGVTASWNF